MADVHRAMLSQFQAFCMRVAKDPAELKRWALGGAAPEAVAALELLEDPEGFRERQREHEAREAARKEARDRRNFGVFLEECKAKDVGPDDALFRLFVFAERNEWFGKELRKGVREFLNGEMEPGRG